MTKSCQHCDRAMGFIEGGSIGLRCGLDNREIMPPLSDDALCPVNTVWLLQWSVTAAMHCPDYRPEVG